MSYKFLLFDLDYTLLDFEAGEEVALTQMLTDMNFPDVEAFKTYYKPLNQGLWRQLEKRLITKSELVNTRFSMAFDYFGLPVDGTKMAKTFQTYMGQQGQTFEGAAQLLAKLTDRGYEIYGATNGITAIQNGRMANSDIQPYFRKIFISEQMGTQKPERTYYKKIGQAISHFDNSRALMIGDSLTADVQGGNNAGIDTIWYNPSQKINKSQAIPTYTVKDFQEIDALLK